MVHYVFYLPAFSLIVAGKIVSPAYEVEVKHPDQTLFTEEIGQQVPKLNRSSDVIWTVWKQQVPSEAQKLRYLAHDFVTNMVTVDLMNYNFGAGYRGEKEVPWPDLELGLDSDKGRHCLHHQAGSEPIVCL